MSKLGFADDVVQYAMDKALDDPKYKDNVTKRAKIYRKAGMELIALAAQMDAELIFK